MPESHHSSPAFGSILVNEMCMCNHNVLNYVLFPRQRKKQKKLSAKKKKEERKDDGELYFLLILTEDEKGFYCR